MKKGIFLLILTIATSVGFAQTQKLGHIDTRGIMQAMYLKDSVQQKLAVFQKMVMAEKERIEQQLQYEASFLERMKDSISPVEFEQRYQAYMVEAQRYQEQTLPQMQQAMSNKEAFYLEPITEKVSAAIEKVAKENGFTYIITAEAALYAGGEDITTLVRVELGLPAEELNPVGIGGGGMGF